MSVSRDVQAELQTLTRDLGMDMSEALSTLGLQSPDDEILQEQDPIESVVEMFPNVDRKTIVRLRDEHNGDLEAVSEELLSLEALRVEESGLPRGSRKLQREKNRLARKVKQQVEREETDIKFVAEELRVPLEEARRLYWLNNSDVAAVMLAKAPKMPLATVEYHGDGKKTYVKEGGGTVLRTHRPPSSPSASQSELREYASMPIHELRAHAADVETRIRTLTSVARRPDPSKPYANLRAKDAARDLHELENERTLIQLALNHPQWLRSANLPAQKLDLHGFSLAEAQVMAADVLQKFKASSACELEIITGAGRHSSRGRAVIKPWLRTYLQSQNVRFRENDGSFVVSQKPIV